MAMIYVKARQGRRAYFEGRVIPEDKFIPVTDTPYMRRLALVWEDVEVEGGEDALNKPPGTSQPRQADRPLSPMREQKPRPRSTLNPTQED